MFVLKSILLSIVGFFSGSIDAVIGGGNLITIALLTLIGLSPLKAIATMQIITLFQNITATFSYTQKKLIDWKQASFLAVFGGLGSFLGSKLLFQIDESILAPLAGLLMIIILIIIPQFQQEDHYQILGPLKGLYKKLFRKRPVITHSQKTKFILAGFSFLIGIYGGFYGAGRGLIMVLVFYILGEAEFLTTVANTKPTDILISLVFILVFPKMENILNLELLVPLITSSVAGSMAGVEIGEKISAKYLQITLYGITIISAIKLIFF